MTEFKVRLVKVASNHNNLRTNEIEGVCERLPSLGNRFILTAPPLEAGDMRMVFTTEIKSMAYDSDKKKYDFHTQNSHYELYIL